MKTQTATLSSRPQHPPHTDSAPAVHVVRHVGPLDRAALHLGLALVKWGRRPIKIDDREQLALNAATFEARREAERLRDLQGARLPRIL